MRKFIVLTTCLMMAAALPALARELGPVAPQLPGKLELVKPAMMNHEIARPEINRLHRTIENQLAEVDALFDNQLDDLTLRVCRQSLLDGYSLRNIVALGENYQLHKNQEFYTPKPLHPYELSDPELFNGIETVIKRMMTTKHRGTYQRDADKNNDGGRWGWETYADYFDPVTGNPVSQSNNQLGIQGTAMAKAFEYGVTCEDDPAGFELAGHLQAIAQWFQDAYDHEQDCGSDGTCAGTHGMGYSCDLNFLVYYGGLVGDSAITDLGRDFFDSKASDTGWVNGIVAADYCLARGFAHYGTWNAAVWNYVPYGYLAYMLGELYSTTGWGGFETNYDVWALEFILRFIIRYNPNPDADSFEIGVGEMLCAASVMESASNPVIDEMREVYRLMLLDERPTIMCYADGKPPVTHPERTTGDVAAWWGWSGDATGCDPGGCKVYAQSTGYAVEGLAADGAVIDQLHDAAVLFFHPDVLDGFTMYYIDAARPYRDHTQQVEPIAGPYAGGYGFGWACSFYADGSPAHDGVNSQMYDNECVQIDADMLLGLIEYALRR